MTDGPYLTAVFICEKIMQEKDDVLSVIRMMDTMILQLPEGAPDDLPSEQNRIPVTFDLLVCLKTGKAPPAPHTLRIEMTSPSTKTSSQTFPFHPTPGEHGGANLILRQTIAIKHGGLFYFDFFVDDNWMTRLPFRIDVKRPEPQQSSPTPTAQEAETPSTPSE